MSNTQLFIPKKIRVGYNKREDTYSKKLGYVIYYDSKNVLRKETSFNSWIDKELGVDEFDNIPMSGFVLNKKVGGNNYSWNPRQTYSRVYDPRGFEIEINIANLLFILQECNSFKGKGLDGEFIYSWDGKELVLLPVESAEYQKCIEYTELQDKNISKKDMVEGYTYIDSKQKQYVYLGYHAYVDHPHSDDREIGSKLEKRHIFLPIGNAYNAYYPYHTTTTLSSFKQIVNDVVADDFASTLQSFLDSGYHQEIAGVEYLPLGDDFVSDTRWITLLTDCGTIHLQFDQNAKSYYISNGRHNYPFSSTHKYVSDEEIKNMRIKYYILKNNQKIKVK